MKLKEIKKVGIIGVGFMGGSLALALKKEFKNIEIIGFARSSESFKRLKKFKALDRVEKNEQVIASESDILILAAPVGVIADNLKKLGSFLKKGAVVFDLGSTKEKLEKTARKFIPGHASFVGCHPFCGSEQNGVEQAKASLYRDSFCFITSSNKASLLVEKIWKRLGSRVVRISPEEHDKLACAVSHLPHLIAFSLVNFTTDKHLAFSSSGFKDLTRIASSSGNLWADIFLANKEKMLEAIDRYVQVLIGVKQEIEKENKKKLKALIRKANQKRNAI